VRAEQYTVLRDEDPTSPPLVVVSRTAELPARVADMSSPAGSALLVTRHGADPAALERARDILGSDNVILAGDDEVDLLLMRKELERKGFRRILSEGGPSLFGSMLDAGIVDEVDLSLAPRVVGGSHPRIVRGGDLTVGLEPTVLVEEEGTVMGRWLVRR
jgi:riboflavin biosynthesis pyrimidine reductase